MTAIPESPHVYNREIQAPASDSLGTIASWIPENATVLDLGCGTGALGRWLKRHAPSCRIDGVTFNAAEGEQARPSYRRLVLGDLETIDLQAEFTAGAYDVIVCADVLEHLRAPQRILKTCKPLLAPGGVLLVSVPNVGYAGLIAELLLGQFKYRPEGLLDETHVRFFTRAGLLDLLSEQAWQVTAFHPIQRQLPDSEFQLPMEMLAPRLISHLLQIPDALSYQFVLSAKPAPTAEKAIRYNQSFADAAHADARLKFSAELFLGNESGYDQKRKISTHGQIGLRKQSLIFEWGAGIEPLTRLRIDPADRPGFFHLHSLQVTDKLGDSVWQWNSIDEPHAPLSEGRVPHHDIQWHLPGLLNQSLILLLLSQDPWFEIPIPTDLLESRCSEGGQLKIEVGWPMSSDYIIAAQESIERRNHIAHILENYSQAEESRRILLEQLNDEITTKKWLFDEVNQLRIRNLELKEAVSRTESALVKRDRELHNLIQHLDWIEQSTVFRVTRPLVKLKMTIQSLFTKPVTDRAAATPLIPPEHPVDIVLPVYRGLSDTQRCLTSALSSRCKAGFRIIVINDASPEPELSEWLRSVATTDPRILLLENPENLGFVGTVNRGMAVSNTNDIVLLNSDTEVANDWLDKLRAAAYSTPLGGTVTPFSNNATICSYPLFCNANPMPEDLTTASLDSVCAITHPGKTLDIPTGVGFCMYIRRDCLQDVGLFDVETFGKGYGEENDFCRRALARGWRNLMALDTFVLHAGGVSFGDSKSARELAAMETLRQLYPEYEADVMRFVQDDPVRPYRQAIDLARLRSDPRPKILAVCHNRGGGTLRHATELAQTLSASAITLLLLPEPGERVSLQYASKSEGLALHFSIASDWEDLIDLLRALPVSLVHFHHLLGHAPIVQSLPSRLDVPYDFTAHDHYSFCPQISLTNETQRYCGEQGPIQCASCLRHSPAPGVVAIETWRANHHQFLRSSRYILAASVDSAKRLKRYFQLPQIQLAPHTDVDPRNLPEPTAQPLLPHETLRVVVIGALSVIKGADALEQVAQLAAKSKAPLEFHLLGYAYRSLRTRPHTHLTVHGEYQDSDLPALLEWLRPHMVWFPAQWPETYSYTLSASLLAGLPVLAPDIGAFPERLENRPWSWLKPWDQTPEQWLHDMMDIRTKHFMPGEAPALLGVRPAGAEGTDQDSQTHGHTPLSGTTPVWDYARDYVPKPGSASLPPLPGLEWLAQHAPAGLNGATQSIRLGVRRQALRGLIRLRSAPGLRRMAQSIPHRWQSRLKSWLMR